MRSPAEPRELPGADPHTGNRLIDPVTGHDTTGHDRGGITDLNTPFPRIILWVLAVSFFCSVVARALLPARQPGLDDTRGMLGLDSGRNGGLRVPRLGLRSRSLDGASCRAGFHRTCVGCRAARPRHACPRPAFPRHMCCLPRNRRSGRAGLSGAECRLLALGWRSGDIAETLTWGLNSMHPDSRIAEMPVFDRMERGERQGLAGFVAALPWGQADHRSLAATLFEESCESCHGPRGERGLMNGAPSLADGASR